MADPTPRLNGETVRGLLVETAKQVPALVVLAVVVYMFNDGQRVCMETIASLVGGR